MNRRSTGDNIVYHTRHDRHDTSRHITVMITRRDFLHRDKHETARDGIGRHAAAPQYFKRIEIRRGRSCSAHCDGWTLLRRAVPVIFGNIPYDEVRRTHNISTLAERRLDLSRTFFKRIIRDNSDVLWYLLSATRDV